MHKPAEFHKVLDLQHVNSIVMSAAKTANRQPTKVMARDDIVHHHNVMRNLALSVQQPKVLALQRLVDWREVEDVVSDGLHQIDHIIEDQVVEPLQDAEPMQWLSDQLWDYEQLHQEYQRNRTAQFE